MKRITPIMKILAASLMLWACGNNTPKRIVSEVPIKTNVLGLNLCSATTEMAIENAISIATDELVITQSQKNGIATVVRVFTDSFDIPYGGLSWHYVDVTLNQDKKIVQISIVASFENIERAKAQFNTAEQIFTQKYGKGNVNKEHTNTFWTDDTNSVGLFYMESSAINGEDRCFCTLYYVNRELSNALQEANTPDI